MYGTNTTSRNFSRVIPLSGPSSVLVNFDDTIHTQFQCMIFVSLVTYGLRTVSIFA